MSRYGSLRLSRQAARSRRRPATPLLTAANGPSYFVTLSATFWASSRACFGVA